MDEKKKALIQMVDRVVGERDAFISKTIENPFNGDLKKLPELQVFLEALVTSDALDVLQEMLKETN